jgi:hypothetical protein
MRWDLGVQGAGLLVAMSIGLAVVAGLLVDGDWPRRLKVAATDAVACVAVGALTSEWLFGWATEEELQPNVDGLSRDEVLLSGILTTVAVVVVARVLANRAGASGRAHPAH